MNYKVGDRIKINDEGCFHKDFDNDGLNNSAELFYGTNMTNLDTDYDSFNDSYEINLGTDPVNKWWKPMPNLRILKFLDLDIYTGVDFYTYSSDSFGSHQDMIWTTRYSINF